MELTRKAVFVLACMAAILSFAFPNAYARIRRNAGPARTYQYQEDRDRVTMVVGAIEDVTPQAVRVNGNYYMFAGVPIHDEQGRPIGTNHLIRGRGVKLFFRGPVLSGIIVYEHLGVQ
ncbi:MAG: hypothetical protein M0Z59_10100 [Nitrospiraceae bacterium]|nr:hypothetical protein [Nitrospiraceae bacterium]